MTVFLFWVCPNLLVYCVSWSEGERRGKSFPVSKRRRRNTLRWSFPDWNQGLEWKLPWRKHLGRVFFSFCHCLRWLSNKCYSWVYLATPSPKQPNKLRFQSKLLPGFILFIVKKYNLYIQILLVRITLLIKVTKIV